MRLLKVISNVFLCCLLFVLGVPELHAEVPDVGPGVCAANCGSGVTGGGHTPSPGPTGPSPEERKQAWEDNDLHEAALDAYDTGMDYYSEGDWKNAISSFKEGLEYEPGNQDIRDALNRAKTRFQAKIREDDQRRREKMRQALKAAAKSRALQEAAAAAAHSKKADSNSSHKESGRVFDTPGSKAKLPKFTPGTAVVAHGVPEEVRRNPRWQALERQGQTYHIQQKKAQKKIDAIKQKLQAGEGDKGKLQVELVHARDAKSTIDSKVNVNRVEMESFKISFEKKAAKKTGNDTGTQGSGK